MVKNYQDWTVTDKNVTERNSDTSPTTVTMTADDSHGDVDEEPSSPSASRMAQLVKITETVQSSTPSEDEKVDAVLTGWEILQNIYSSGGKFEEPFELLYSATVRVILGGQWFNAMNKNNYKNGDILKKRMLSSLESIIDKTIETNPRAYKMCNNLIPLLDKNPWILPYIEAILMQTDTQDSSVVETLWEKENQHLIEQRLECLCTMKMFSRAYNFALVCYLECKKCVDQSSESQCSDTARELFCNDKFSDEISNIFYLLLCRLKSDSAIEQYLTISEALEVICRLTGETTSSRIAPKMKDWKKGCKTIINVTADYVANQVAEHVDINVVKLVYFKWTKHSDKNEIELAQKLLSRLGTISTYHVYAFADVIVEHYGSSMGSLQKALELYIRAMTYDINEIEKLDVALNQSDKKQTLKNKLAERYLHLSTTMFSCNQKISWQLTLTAFSLCPSQHLFDKLFSRGEEIIKYSGPGAKDNGTETQADSDVSDILLTKPLSEDLQTVIDNPRWKSLCWAKDKTELENLCRQQLDTGGPKIKAKEDLTHLHINYDEYEPRPSNSTAEIDYGFEKGYEPKQFLAFFPRKRGRHKKNLLVKKIKPPRATYSNSAYNKGRKKFGVTRPANKVYKTSNSGESGLSRIKQTVKKGETKKCGSTVALDTNTEHLKRYQRRKKKTSQIRDHILSVEMNSFLTKIPRPYPIARNSDRAQPGKTNDIAGDGEPGSSNSGLAVACAPNLIKFNRCTTTHCSSEAELGDINVASINSPNFNGFQIRELESIEANEKKFSSLPSLQTNFLPSPDVQSVHYNLGKTDLLNMLETGSYLSPIQFRLPSTSPESLINLNPVVELERTIPADMHQDNAKSQALDILIKTLKKALAYLRKGCFNPSLSPTLTAAIEQSKLNNLPGNSDYNMCTLTPTMFPQIISEVCKHKVESSKCSQAPTEEPTCPVNYLTDVINNTSRITRKPGPKRKTNKLYTEQMVRRASENLKKNIIFKAQVLGLELVQGRLIRSSKQIDNNLIPHFISQESVGSSTAGETTPVEKLYPQYAYSGQFMSSGLSMNSVGFAPLENCVVAQTQSLVEAQFGNFLSPCLIPEGLQNQGNQTHNGIIPEQPRFEYNIGSIPADSRLNNTQAPLPLNPFASQERTDFCLNPASAEPLVMSTQEIGNSTSMIIEPVSGEIGIQHNPTSCQVIRGSREGTPYTSDKVSPTETISVPKSLSSLPEMILQIAEILFPDIISEAYDSDSAVEQDEESESNDCRESLVSVGCSRAGPRSKTKIAVSVVDFVQSGKGNEIKDVYKDMEADIKDTDNIPSDIEDNQDNDYVPSDEDDKKDDYVPPSPKKNQRKKRQLGKASSDKKSKSSGNKRRTSDDGSRKRGAKRQNVGGDKDMQTSIGQLPPLDSLELNFNPIVPKPIKIDDDALQNHSVYCPETFYLNHCTGYFQAIDCNDSDIVFHSHVVPNEGDNFWDNWPDSDLFALVKEDSMDALCGGAPVAPGASDDLAALHAKIKQIESDSKSTKDGVTSKYRTDEELRKFYGCKPVIITLARISERENKLVSSASAEKTGNSNQSEISGSTSDKSNANLDTSTTRKNRRVSKVTSRGAEYSNSRLRQREINLRSRNKKKGLHKSKDKLVKSVSKRKPAQKPVQKKPKKPAKKRAAGPKSKKRNSVEEESSSSESDEVEIILLDSEHESDYETESPKENYVTLIPNIQSEDNKDCTGSTLTFEPSPVKDDGETDVTHELEEDRVVHEQERGTDVTHELEEERVVHEQERETDVTHELEEDRVVHEQERETDVTHELEEDRVVHEQERGTDVTHELEEERVVHEQERETDVTHELEEDRVVHEQERETDVTHELEEDRVVHEQERETDVTHELEEDRVVHEQERETDVTHELEEDRVVHEQERETDVTHELEEDRVVHEQERETDVTHELEEDRVVHEQERETDVTHELEEDRVVHEQERNRSWKKLEFNTGTLDVIDVSSGEEDPVADPLQVGQDEEELILESCDLATLAILPTLIPAPVHQVLPVRSVSASASVQPNMPSLLRAPAAVTKSNLLRAPNPDRNQVLTVLKVKKEGVRETRKRQSSRVTKTQQKPAKKSKRSDITCRDTDLPVLSKADDNVNNAGLEIGNCRSPAPPTLQPEV